MRAVPQCRLRELAQGALARPATSRHLGPQGGPQGSITGDHLEGQWN